MKRKMKRMRAVVFTLEYHRITVEFEVPDNMGEDEIEELAYDKAYNSPDATTKFVDGETIDIEIEDVE